MSVHCVRCIQSLCKGCVWSLLNAASAESRHRGSVTKVPGLVGADTAGFLGGLPAPTNPGTFVTDPRTVGARTVHGSAGLGEGREERGEIGQNNS